MRLISKYPTKAILTLLILFFLLLSYSTFAGDGNKSEKTKTTRVHGIVLDEYGLPVPEATVQIYNEDQLIYETKTDKKGTYEIKARAGVIIIEINKTCYQPVNVEMERVENESGTKLYGYLMQVDMKSMSKKECKDDPLPPKASVSISRMTKF